MYFYCYVTFIINTLNGCRLLVLLVLCGLHKLVAQSKAHPHRTLPDFSKGKAAYDSLTRGLEYSLRKWGMESVVKLMEQQEELIQKQDERIATL